MIDYGHNKTDQQLAELERKIAKVYGEAEKELQKTIDEYFAKFEERDKHQLQLLKDGKITEQQYKQWRLAQIGRGKRFEALRDKIAERYTKANETAVAYVNDETPGIYSLNRNYSAYTIEQVAGNIGFDLWDEQTVKRMIVEEPDLMPYYPEEKALNRGLDLEWGKKQITAAVTSGILQGKSIGGLAKDLQSRMKDMNQTSAIRTARTAVTGAQNAGRQDGFVQAAKMGIKVRKRWVAVKDNRTRHDHAIADGQIVNHNEAFEVGGYKMMYPGDNSALGYLVYNCRCTMRTVEKEGIEAEPRQMRVRDSETGRNVLISDMTYQEWEAWKRDENPQAWETYMKKGKNYSSDQKQYAEYKKILGNKIPSTFAAFQDLKYNDAEAWKDLKTHYRYKRRVPEATTKDYESYKAIKNLGVNGTIRVPAQPIFVGELSFKDEHGTRHGCTLENAKNYVSKAKCSITRKKWDGIHTNYYSFEGATYLDSDMRINTAFPKEKFDTTTSKILEVFK